MYKKIKNSSFMNLIWFVICVLPLCFILFSLNNEDNKTQVYQNEFNIINDNSNMYLFDYDGDSEINLNVLNNSLILDNNEENTSYTLSLDILENVQKDYWYYLILKLPYKVSVYNISISTANGNFTNDILFINSDGNNYIDYIVLPFQYNFILSNDNHFPLYISINFEINDFTSNDYSVELSLFVNENYIEKEYFEGFTNEIIIQSLNYWFNNFKSNGFISSTFLNLAILFGVNNVYYSLACYYIEYLLVIALLHLAFDVLYMLPNICHKFMEKIGGERD